MARFRFSGTITRTTVEKMHIEDGIITVTKKSVCQELGLPNVVDGDPQHWIDEAEIAVEYGAHFTVTDTDGAKWERDKQYSVATEIDHMEYDA